MLIKEFIEAAIEGGWKKGEEVKLDPKYGLIISWTTKKDHDNANLAHGMTILDWTELYLDPEAWKAVMKTMSKGRGFTEYYIYEIAKVNMSLMVERLFEGKTLEEYISTL